MEEEFAEGPMSFRNMEDLLNLLRARRSMEMRKKIVVDRSDTKKVMNCHTKA